MLTWNWNNCT